MVGAYTKVKTQSELPGDVNRQRPKDVFVPLGQSIYPHSHDDLSDKLDEGSLHYLEYHQTIASIDDGGYKQGGKTLGFPKVRTTSLQASIKR